MRAARRGEGTVGRARTAAAVAANARRGGQPRGNPARQRAQAGANQQLAPPRLLARARPFRFPYVVNLLITTEGGDVFVCGGSLIRADVVLTAAQ